MATVQEQEFLIVPLSEVHERWNIEQTPDENYKTHYAWMRADIPDHGLNDPIEVARDDGGGFGIVNGTKRWKVLQELVSTKKTVKFSRTGQLIPVGSIPVILSPFTGREAYLQAYRENSTHPLSDLDLGRHFEKVLEDVPHGNKQEEEKRLGRDLNLSHARVEQCLALWRKLKADQETRKDLEEGKITTRHADIIGKLSKPESRRALANVTKRMKLSTDETAYVEKALSLHDKSLAGLSEEELTEKARKYAQVAKTPELVAGILDIADLPLIKKYCHVVVEAVKCPGCGARVTHFQCTAKPKPNKPCPNQQTICPTCKQPTQDIKLSKAKATVSIGTDPMRFREACAKFLKTPLKPKARAKRRR